MDNFDDSFDNAPTIVPDYRPAGVGKSLSSLDTMPTIVPDLEVRALGRVDKYELLEKLGGGGFGVVYKARDTYSDIEVAIKTIHPLLKSDVDELERMKENFRRIEKLSHPNIASVRDLSPVENVSIQDEAAARDLDLHPGDPILVMSFARGVTLQKWKRQFKDGLVPPGLVIEIGRQTALALDYAHSERIVHRDIKPANIVVETDPESQKLNVHVLDFGLAAEIRNSMSRISASSEGGRSGTRYYMAPEQWKGGDIDGAADQYALAVVLYELFSGRTPFASVFELDDPVAMMGAVEQCMPDTIPGVDARINEAVQKALSKDRKDRFRTCGDFIRAMSGTPMRVELSAVRVGGTAPQNDVPAAPQPPPANVAAAAPVPQAVEVKPVSPVSPATAVSQEPLPPEQPSPPNMPEIPDVLRKLVVTAQSAGRLCDSVLRKASASARDLAQKVGVQVKGGTGPVAGHAGTPSTRSAADQREWAEKLAALPKPKVETFDLGGGLAFEMVQVPKGTFGMGSCNGRNAEQGRLPGESLHVVRLTVPFRLASTSVTLGQWRTVMGGVPARCAGGNDNLPVTGVSWNDCLDFCEKLNAMHPVKGCKWSLPTEAQWEFACRAATSGPYAGTERLDDMGWYGGNAGGQVHPVRTKKPNRWGLYDMHGNVWEWCADGWIPSLGHDPRTDPCTAPEGMERVVRGGSWNNNAALCRSASRRGMARTSRFDNVGFRVALVSIS